MSELKRFLWVIRQNISAVVYNHLSIENLHVVESLDQVYDS